jgi:hypothetical protein
MAVFLWREVKNGLQRHCSGVPLSTLEYFDLRVDDHGAGPWAAAADAGDRVQPCGMDRQ